MGKNATHASGSRGCREVGRGEEEEGRIERTGGVNESRWEEEYEDSGKRNAEVGAACLEPW